jgi:hypothetical protein
VLSKWKQLGGEQKMMWKRDPMVQHWRQHRLEEQQEQLLMKDRMWMDLRKMLLLLFLFLFLLALPTVLLSVLLLWPALQQPWLSLWSVFLSSSLQIYGPSRPQYLVYLVSVSSMFPLRYKTSVLQSEGCVLQRKRLVVTANHVVTEEQLLPGVGLGSQESGPTPCVSDECYGGGEQGNEK